MKTVFLEGRRVEDVHGLLIDLRRARFAVVNVGTDSGGTHVFLEDGEDKDPSAIAESWAGKPAPEPTRDLAERRAKDLEEIADAERRAAEISDAPRPEADAAVAPGGQGWRSRLARFFRKVR